MRTPQVRRILSPTRTDRKELETAGVRVGEVFVAGSEVTVEAAAVSTPSGPKTVRTPRITHQMYHFRKMDPM